MKKIEIILEDHIFAALQSYAQAINVNPQEACKLLITANTLLFVKSPNKIATIESPKEDEFDDLKKIMNIYNITQLDLASFLRITQSGVSFAITKKKENSVLFKRIELLGIEKFILQVFKHKYYKVGDDLLRNWKFDPLITPQALLVQEPIPYQNWHNWQKILLGFILSSNYIDIRDDTFLLTTIATKIDNISADKNKILEKAEDEGLDSYINTLRQIYENEEV